MLDESLKTSDFFVRIVTIKTWVWILHECATRNANNWSNFFGWLSRLFSILQSSIILLCVLWLLFHFADLRFTLNSRWVACASHLNAPSLLAAQPTTALLLLLSCAFRPAAECDSNWRNAWRPRPAGCSATSHRDAPGSIRWDGSFGRGTAEPAAGAERSWNGCARRPTGIKIKSIW